MDESDVDSLLPVLLKLNQATAGSTMASGAFQAAARPLLASVAGGQWGQGSPLQGPASGSTGTVAAAGGIQALSACQTMTLADLVEGPYFVIASQLDSSDLCRTDATCRLLQALNRAHIGPWRFLGARVFHGMELEMDGIFDEDHHSPSASTKDMRSEAACGGRKLARVDWKGRFRRFWTEVSTFRAPFIGTEITTIRHPDEVAYCRCRLRTDLLDVEMQNGVYLEVEVLTNPDNLSLAVVDFDAGGRSSVTFSPDTGAVIRERKVQEAPRKVEGAYIQPLATTPKGKRFEGHMGVYLHGGHLAFFRRCSDLPWESTGFITDLMWAEGRRLTPCLAFRDQGAYCVRLVRVGSLPPLLPERSDAAYEDLSWSSLDWEVGEPTAPDV